MCMEIISEIRKKKGRSAFSAIGPSFQALAGLLLFGRVDDLDAAVLAPARLAVLFADRALFAVADDIELAGRSAGSTHGAGHGIAAALAEAEVVFTRAALVGVAFQRYART